MMYKGNRIGVFGNSEWNQKWVDDFIKEYGDSIETVRKSGCGHSKIFLKDSSVIETCTPSENARGHAFDKVYISPVVDAKIIDNIIRPMVKIDRVIIEHI